MQFILYNMAICTDRKTNMVAVLKLLLFQLLLNKCNIVTRSLPPHLGFSYNLHYFNRIENKGKMD